MNGRRIRTWVWVVVFLSSPVWTYAQQDQPAVSGSSTGASAVAEVPRLIKFSGEVLDARGEPLGSVAVRLSFAVYEEQTGGAASGRPREGGALPYSGKFTRRSFRLQSVGENKLTASGCAPFGVTREDGFARPRCGFAWPCNGFAWVSFGFVFRVSSCVFNTLVASFLHF